MSSINHSLKIQKEIALGVRRPDLPEFGFGANVFFSFHFSKGDKWTVEQKMNLENQILKKLQSLDHQHLMFVKNPSPRPETYFDEIWCYLDMQRIDNFYSLLISTGHRSQTYILKSQQGL